MELIRLDENKNGIPVYRPKSINELILFGIAHWDWIDSPQLRASIDEDLDKATEYNDFVIQLEFSDKRTARVDCSELFESL